MLSLISNNNVYIYTVIFLLLIISIIYMFLIADEKSSIAQQNKNLLVLSWITTSFGALLIFLPFALLAFPLPFNIRVCMIVMGIILSAIGGFGLFIGYNDKFTDESKADKYNIISSVLSAVSFFALGNVVPKLLN